MELYHRVTVARDTGLDRVATLDQENAQLGAQLDDLKVATKTQVCSYNKPLYLCHCHSHCHCHCCCRELVSNARLQSFI